jgi:hypothetical protein
MLLYLLMHAHAPHATRTPFYSSPAFLLTPLSPLIPQNPRWIGGVEMSSRQARTWANRQKMPGSGVFRSQRGPEANRQLSNFLQAACSQLQYWVLKKHYV